MNAAKKFGAVMRTHPVHDGKIVCGCLGESIVCSLLGNGTPCQIELPTMTGCGAKPSPFASATTGASVRVDGGVVDTL